MRVIRRHFLACEDVAGGSQQSGCEIRWPVRWVPAVRWRNHYFARNKEAFPCVRRYSWWVRAVSGGNVFFAKYGVPFGGSPLSVGGIIIFLVIRRHFLAAAVDPAVSLSTYSPRPMESRSLTTLTTLHREHQGGGQRRGLRRGRRGAGEDAAVEARAERSTRVHWFGWV